MKNVLIESHQSSMKNCLCLSKVYFTKVIGVAGDFFFRGISLKREIVALDRQFDYVLFKVTWHGQLVVFLLNFLLLSPT